MNKFYISYIAAILPFGVFFGIYGLIIQLIGLAIVIYFAFRI